MPFLSQPGGGADLPQAVKLALSGAAQTLRVGGGSDLVSGVVEVGGAQRISLVAANSGALTRPDLASLWVFQGVDTSGANIAGPMDNYLWLFGIRATAVGGGVLPDDVWVGLCNFNDGDPATAVISNTSPEGAGVAIAGAVQSAEARAIPQSLTGRGTWNRGNPLNSPTGNAGIRTVWGPGKSAANANGFGRSIIGSIAYGTADFPREGDVLDAIVLQVASFDVETNLPAANPDFATILACVGTDGALGADLDIDVEFYYQAIPWGLASRGFA